jgi:metallothionein
MSDNIQCDAKRCVCEVQSADAITADGRSYCSERCLDGRGCDHPGCNCGEWPVPEPKPDHPHSAH